MTQEELLKELIRDGYIRSPLVKDAFTRIKREDFVSEEMKVHAYENYPLPIGFSQTVSQPLTVAFLLELLALQYGEKVLEIGCGSGWQTALMAAIVGRAEKKTKDNTLHEGKIIAVERIEELTHLATRNLEKYKFISDGIVEVIYADGVLGYEQESPFDAIVCSASVSHIPGSWKEQVKIGGRIIAPVGESIVVLEKTSTDVFQKKQYFGFSFVPLQNGIE